MPAATRICKVCGKPYEYCHTNRTTADIFRWQDVACCPEHGSTYFDMILESRKSKSVRGSSADNPNDKVNDFSDLIEDDECKLFEEDFDDDESE